MAKSLRSKHKRKLRAVKRERYAVKELNRLKNMLESTKKNDVEMSRICTMTTTKEILQKKKEKKEKENQETENMESEYGVMEVDKKERKFCPKTMKDQFGNYPVWMSQRVVAKHKGKKKGKKKPAW